MPVLRSTGDTDPRAVVPRLMPAPARRTDGDLARLFVMRVELPTGDPYEFTLADVLAIDPDDVTGETVGHAQRYGLYAMFAVSYEEQLAAAKTSLGRHAAVRHEAVRKALAAADGVRLKDLAATRVKEIVASEAETRRLADRVDALEQQVRRMAVIREALVHRRDMLRSVAMYRAPESSAPATIPAHPGRYRLGTVKRRLSPQEEIAHGRSR